MATISDLTGSLDRIPNFPPLFGGPKPPKYDNNTEPRQGKVIIGGKFPPCPQSLKRWTVPNIRGKTKSTPVVRTNVPLARDPKGGLTQPDIRTNLDSIIKEADNHCSLNSFFNLLDNWGGAISEQYLWSISFNTIDTPGAHYPVAIAGVTGTIDDNGIVTDNTLRPIGGLENLGPAGDKGSGYRHLYDSYGFFNGPGGHPLGGGFTGCLFANGVNIPGEQVSYEQVSVENNGGLLPILVGGQRAAPQELTINFRETNASFTDSILRPWIIFNAHLGLATRRDHANLKVNITVQLYTRTLYDRPLALRKRFIFYNALPFSVDSADLTYENVGMQFYTARFGYTHYTVELPQDTIGLSKALKQVIDTRALVDKQKVAQARETTSTKANVMLQEVKPSSITQDQLGIKQTSRLSECPLTIQQRSLLQQFTDRVAQLASGIRNIRKTKNAIVRLKDIKNPRDAINKIKDVNQAIARQGVRGPVAAARSADKTNSAIEQLNNAIKGLK